MSRFPPVEFRGFRERSRSPPRFADRRSSSANVFDNRPSLSRAASDAPRGPRVHTDGPRPFPPALTPTSSLGTRQSYTSLRDAPPLGAANDRNRPFRDRDFDRRDRVPSPRERSPARNFKDTRDYFPARELDVPRPRRNSRDGPLSAGSSYSEGSSFAPSNFRGGLGRGRGRGDAEFRGGRGGWRNNDDRDLFRRERSPGRWPARDAPRDDREPERREDRRFERRDDDRRPDWTDREREADRSRRDGPLPRLENRPLVDSSSSTPTHFSSTSAAPVDPGRLALIDGGLADVAGRKATVAQGAVPAVRRDGLEGSYSMNSRPGPAATRYNQRASSPPTQAPPVPAFTLSFAPAAPISNSIVSGGANVLKQEPGSSQTTTSYAQRVPTEDHPADAAQVPQNGAQESTTADSKLSNHEAQPSSLAPGPSNAASAIPPQHALIHEADNKSVNDTSVETQTGALDSSSKHLVRPLSPEAKHVPGAPTGPRAARIPLPQTAVSARNPPTAPRLDQIPTAPAMSSMSRTSVSNPRSVPNAPRYPSTSVSPNISNTVIPTAPKADRMLQMSPRSAERSSVQPTRPGDRTSSRTSPTLSRQWNQWRRPEITSVTAERVIPAKRDYAGEEKDSSFPDKFHAAKLEPLAQSNPDEGLTKDMIRDARSSLEGARTQIQQPLHHSAARSFFGQSNHGPASDEFAGADEATTSSEEDELNPEEDAALFNAKFERQKRLLESQLIDLGAQRYRATTPLESIARLARISLSDLQRLTEHDEMDMDPSLDDSRALIPTARNSDSEGNADVLTPKGEDDAFVGIRGVDDAPVFTRQFRRPTPEVIELPFLTKEDVPFHRTDAFQYGIARYEDNKSAVLDTIDAELVEDEAHQNDLDDLFAGLYQRWREDCEHFDWQAEEQERLERQQSLEPGPEADLSVAAPPNTTEGRRLLKFSSEYEIEQVLKQSEETARIEQERSERESKRLQADLEKEAIVPDQLTENDERISSYVDNNRLRDPERLTLVFSFEPPADSFTENEQQIFIAAFKETPKKWGEIASLLPGRTYRDCIHHYYTNKWDGRFRDSRTKRFKTAARRGRGGRTAPRGRGSALMADLGRTEDLAPTMVSDSGRPKRAAAPTTFGEREPPDNKAALGISPAKKSGPGARQEVNGEGEKPAKRRRGAGEKPGRKPKASQPLAALAAAPISSPEKSPFIAATQVKEDPIRAQSLEDASLLTGFQAGRHAPFLPDQAQSVFSKESYVHALALEDLNKAKAGPASSAAKPSASSYWSVPEQTDFAKYIAYFGTDFGAIAAHMGTKTQTMIKNHYLRQIDGGNRPELENAAKDADRRKERGELLGMPPAPTPIVKRKYDNPPPTAPRALAPHKDGLDSEESRQPRLQPSLVKHGSPPQFQSQPRFTSMAQSTPILAQRAIPSPVRVDATLHVSQQPSLQPLHSRTLSQNNQTPVPPQNYGSRLTFMPEGLRSDGRSGSHHDSSFRSGTESSHIQGQSTQGSRPDAADPSYISGLVAQQEQALRMQQEHSQQERFDSNFSRQQAMRPMNQSSPALKPLQSLGEHMNERGPERALSFADEKVPTPPRSSFPPTPGVSRPLLGQPMFGQLATNAFSPVISSRRLYAASPSRREETRPVQSLQMTNTPTPSTTVPDPPKRSNLLSILNSDPEEPTVPAKREPMVQRTSSPANLGFGAPTSMPPSHSHRDIYASAPSSTAQQPRPSQYTLGNKDSIVQQPLTGLNPAEPSTSQPVKPDWASRVLAGTSHPTQPSSSVHERDVRPYWAASHRNSSFGTLGQASRVDPSPPSSLATASHHRGPSMASQPMAQLRDQAPSASQQRPHTPLQTLQAMQTNTYNQPSSQSGYRQSTPTRSSLQSNQSQNLPSTGGYRGFHVRTSSREEPLRTYESSVDRGRERERESKRERERDLIEREEREWRQRNEATSIERREQERQAQHHPFARSSYPPQSSHPAPSPFGGLPPSQSRIGLSLREQSSRDAEAAKHAAEEEQRQRAMDMERHRHSTMQQQQQQSQPQAQTQVQPSQGQSQRDQQTDDYRRRPDNVQFRSMLGMGGFGGPPSSTQQPPSNRR